MSVETVTARGIEILSAQLPDAEVTGQYDEDVSGWTWTVLVPAPTDDNPDAMTGVSRQFVPTSEMAEPSEEYLGLVATEIASVLT